MPVPFLDATPSQCRFPAEGGGLSLIVCGAPIHEPSGSYCPACRSLAYRGGSAPFVLSPWTPSPPLVNPERETTPDLVEVFA